MPALEQRVRCRAQPVVDVVADDPARRAGDPLRQPRVPERVVDVDHDADAGVADPLGDVQRLAERDDRRPLADHHRVQRLDAQPHAVLDRVREQPLDARPRSSPGRAPRSFVAGGPQTSTSASVPSAAASSTARRLSSSAAVGARRTRRGTGYETRRPGVGDPPRAPPRRRSRPSLCRHGPIHSMPCSAQRVDRPRRSDQRSAVIELKLEPAVRHCHARASAEHAPHARARELGVAQQPGLVGEHEQLGEVQHRARRSPARRPSGSAPGGR